MEQENQNAFNPHAFIIKLNYEMLIKKAAWRLNNYIYHDEKQNERKFDGLR